MTPFYDFRDWLMEQPTMRTLLEYDGTGLVPVFPAAEQPETQFPYMRYGTSTTNDPETWWMNTDDLVFTIFHKEPESLQQIVNFIKESTERGSESAEIINTWMEDNARNDYIFTSFETRSIGQELAPEEEGGAFVRQISIRYKYLIR